MSILVLLHAGALAGLFTLASSLGKDKKASIADLLVQFSELGWCLVAGLLLALLAGLCVWLNWSYHSENYDQMANYEMLINREAWLNDPINNWKLDLTHWLGLAFGLASAAMLGVAAYMVLGVPF